MGLRDLIKKKDRLADGRPADAETMGKLSAPDFTFIRSDTYSQEVIHPPSGPGPESDRDGFGPGSGAGSSHSGTGAGAGAQQDGPGRGSVDAFKPPARSDTGRSWRGEKVKREGGRSGVRRLSNRLHLSHSAKTSDFVPPDLPQIRQAEADGDVDRDTVEREWETRATILARQNENLQRTRSAASSRPGAGAGAGAGAGLAQRPRRDTVVSTKAIDDDIQEAIRLHEEGELTRSTAIFGRLADPKGANNPLSQVLYGLALRHGWGCEPDSAGAVEYLSVAASNAALIENLALQAGMRKGGAAKGELVLAIFELANCFRHGWGISKDAVAAKQYYETAANLGDTDAMNEVAWCYLEGYGCKKNKFMAAKYYRLAEEKGHKTLGNTWIWKDKYNAEAKK